jgi:hypothetical protein
MACISLRAGMLGKKGPKVSKSEKVFCIFADVNGSHVEMVRVKLDLSDVFVQSGVICIVIFLRSIVWSILKGQSIGPASHAIGEEKDVM